MRNNPYKNMIKVLTPKKNDKLIIQRKGNEYFITECHIAFRLSHIEYSTYLHSEKPLVFPILESDSCISNGEPCGMDVDKLFEQNSTDSFYGAFDTDFIKDIKGDLARLYLIEDQTGAYVPMLINEKFHQAITAFNISLSCDGSNRRPLIIRNHDNSIFGIICPIDYGNDNLRKHGKALADLSNIDILSVKKHIA